jgi:hypothetical protein
MAKKIAVLNAESKTDDVEIRSNGARRAEQPHPLGNLGPIEACRYPECGYRM